ncbi:MAG: sodium:proline symporter, partial [Ignavibacteria bacterium]|nr:sodium:proline symporter [Ignavibacteria bacterium]
FFAAYMSTIATHLNWGTSYFINDFYKRFIAPGRPEKSYVKAGRFVTIVFMAISVLVTSYMTSISGVWAFVIECGAGLGLILILRWYWWRINAISEIVATVTPFVVYGILYFGKFGVKFPDTLFIIVPITTLAWLITVFITKPVEDNKLSLFYKRVHPGGVGWRVFRTKHPEVRADRGYLVLFIDWVLGVILVYMFLFGIGKIILGDFVAGVIYIILGIAAGSIILKHVNYLGWDEVRK